jgi:CRP-like cAMP-binding protein
MSDPTGSAFVDRLRSALAGARSTGKSVWSRITDACRIDAFRPASAEGVVRTPHAAGVVLETADLRSACHLSAAELELFDAMDGSRTVMELLYRDMAATGSLALERVAGLVSRLKRAGLLRGEFAIADRIRAALAGRSAGDLLRRAAQAMRFLTVAGEVAAGPLAVLGRIAAPLATRAGLAILVMAGLSGLWPARALLAPGRADILAGSGGNPVAGLAWILGIAWAIHLARAVAVAIGLAARGAPVALDLGLATGLPSVAVSARTRRIAGERCWAEALQAPLLVDVTVASAGAWAAWGGVAPELAASRTAWVGAAWLLADLCPLVDLAAYRLACAASGLHDLRDRSLEYLLVHLPRRLVRLARILPETVGEAEAGAGAGPTATGADRVSWYLAYPVAIALWIGLAVALAWMAIPAVVAPSIRRFVETADARASALLVLALAGLAIPPVVSFLGHLVRAAHRIALAGSGFVHALETSLYVPLSLIACIGIPLVAASVEPPHHRLISVSVAGGAMLALPILAMAASRYHTGSRLAAAFRWLALFHVAVACSIPLDLGRLDLLPSLGPAARFLQAVTSLSFMVLFPFFLFVFLHPGGRWMAAVAVIAPFAAALAFFGLEYGALLSEKGMAALSIAGPAGFCVLSFLTLFGFLDTPLAAFWTFQAGSLGLLALSRVPHLLLILDSTGQEELAFTFGVRSTAGLLAIAALAGYLLAFRRLALPGLLLDAPAAGAGGSRLATQEAVILVEGFTRLTNGLLRLLAGHLGRSRATMVLDAVASRLDSLALPVDVVEEGVAARRDAEPPPMMDLARGLRRVAADVLRGIVYLAGEEFLKRSLRLTQDSLYWVERELLSYYVFRDVDWGTGCRSVTYGVEARTRLAVLREIPLFAVLTAEQIAEVALQLRRRDAIAGETIIRQGEPGDEFYVILEGMAEVTAEDGAGLPRHVATLGALDCFGEVALLDGVARTATVRALEPTVLLCLSEAEFNRTIGSLPEASRKVIPMIRYGSFLARVPLFADLAGAQLLDLSRRLVEERVEAGQVVVREGEPGDRFYLVREGKLSVTRGGESVAQLSEGEYFGEIALVAHRPRVATVTASAPTVLLGLSREDFYSVLSGFLGAYRRLEQFAHRRLYMLQRDPRAVAAPGKESVSHAA